MIDEAHIFNNRYRLDNKLGEGGMATVFCGTDTLLRRRVAVKVLRAQYASDEEFVRRFYQEAESAARLSHPNIVNTYDVGREGETYYIVMELVDGPSLADLIAADGRLPEPVAIDYAAQICNGLAYAHRQGLLHRDIKPANILITKDDVVKLSDFGIARAMSQQTMAMTRPGLVMGSVYYLSPEQAQGLELHETSDLYSVGVVLYQMLMGKLPYTGESPVTVALKHVSEPVPVIDPAETGVSPALASIVNRLLQKQPEHRFQSASEVASALREARDRPSVATFTQQDDSSPLTIPAPPPRPSRFPDTRTETRDEEEPARSRSMGPIFVLLLIAAIIAAAAGYFATRPPSQARIALDNYTGMTDAQAQQAIVNAGLNYKLTRGASSTVPANRVVRQDPAPGTLLPKGSSVLLDISTGLPSVGLKDYTSYTIGDAQKDLTSDKFQVKVIRKYDPSPKDTVLRESPNPGAKVRQGSTVTLVVSNGPAPIHVPNLIGMTVDKANAIAEKDGFTVVVSERASIANIPPNVITSQDPQSGNTIPADHSAVVNVVVSSGGGLTQVPDVTGNDYVTALQKLQQAGFTVDTEYAVNKQASANDNGQVIDESPPAGTAAEKGTSVKIVYSVFNEIPDTNGLSIDDAKKILLNHGYSIGNLVPTQEGADGNVVRTEPDVGTDARLGTPVNIYYNSPSAQPQQQ